MNPLNWFTVEQVQGLVRHIMTTLGGVAFVSAHFDPTAWQTVVGAAAIIGGVVWSYLAKKLAPEAPKNA